MNYGSPWLEINRYHCIIWPFCSCYQRIGYAFGSKISFLKRRAKATPIWHMELGEFYSRSYYQSSVGVAHLKIFFTVLPITNQWHFFENWLCISYPCLTSMIRSERHQNDVIDMVLVCLLLTLTLNIFHNFFYCFICWFWTGNYLLEITIQIVISYLLISVSQRMAKCRYKSISFAGGNWKKFEGNVFPKLIIRNNIIHAFCAKIMLLIT